MSAASAKARAISVGYSRKPLSQKLGLKAGMRVSLHDVPAEYREWCDLDEAGIEIVAANARGVDFAHIFAAERSKLEHALKKIVPRLAATGMLWVSWPKKSARVASDIGEGTLREIVLPLGLVDIKVCAVSEVWSGLKFVWRVERRATIDAGKRT
ncbi:MAG: DUF3052 domain-containing protein [Rudaea sp.]